MDDFTRRNIISGALSGAAAGTLTGAAEALDGNDEIAPEGPSGQKPAAEAAKEIEEGTPVFIGADTIEGQDETYLEVSVGPGLFEAKNHNIPDFWELGNADTSYIEMDEEWKKHAVEAGDVTNHVLDQVASDVSPVAGLVQDQISGDDYDIDGVLLKVEGDRNSRYAVVVGTEDGTRLARGVVQKMRENEGYFGTSDPETYEDEVTLRQGQLIEFDADGEAVQMALHSEGESIAFSKTDEDGRRTGTLFSFDDMEETEEGTQKVEFDGVEYEVEAPAVEGPDGNLDAGANVESEVFEEYSGEGSYFPS